MNIIDNENRKEGWHFVKLTDKENLSSKWQCAFWGEDYWDASKSISVINRLEDSNYKLEEKAIEMPERGKKVTEVSTDDNRVEGWYFVRIVEKVNKGGRKPKWQCAFWDASKRLWEAPSFVFNINHHWDCHDSKLEYDGPIQMPK